MKMDCQQFRKLISDALDGTLTPEQSEAFARHRNECRSCDREFLKQRRIKLYLQSFPTVREVDEAFRRELVARLRRGEMRRPHVLRLPAVAGTLAVICLLLIGILFGIKTYHQYLFREGIFIARFEPPGAGAEPYEQSGQGVQVGVLTRTDGPIYVLNLLQLRPEEFVIRLLAKYQTGEVREELVRRVLVDTGLLEGVRLHWLEQDSFQQFIGRPQRAEIIFPQALPDRLVVMMSGDELLSLRRVGLDVVYAFGIYVPQLKANVSDELRQLVPRTLQNAELIDLLGSSFQEKEIAPDASFITLIRFAKLPPSQR